MDIQARGKPAAASARSRPSPCGDDARRTPITSISSTSVAERCARSQWPSAQRPEQAPLSSPRAPSARLFFDPPAFNADKLTVVFLNGAIPLEPLPLASRRYTLTHSDLTGQLLLSVGRHYNQGQLSGWYIRLLRDEVLAEWRWEGAPTLHVHCHVSGQERWLAPPQLRNYIFKREMALVLDTLAYAERELLEAHPEFAHARVLVHLSSDVQALDCTLEWGLLGFRDSWRRGPTSMLQRVLAGLRGKPSFWASNILPKRSLLESLDDSEDDFDGSLPLLHSSVQSPLSKEASATNTDFHLPPLPANPQLGCAVNTVAAESHALSSAAAWRQHSSAAAEAGHGWGLAAEFAASASTLLPSPSNGDDSHSVSDKRSVNAENNGNNMLQDGLQDTRWVDVLRVSEDLSCNGVAAASKQVPV